MISFADLARLGYDPIPLIPDEKRPRDTGWPALRYDPDKENGCTQIGIRLGIIRGLDIDVMDAKLAAALERKSREFIGKKTPTRTGKAPKRLLLFKVEGPGPKIKLIFSKGKQQCAVEVLGRGQQCVVAGIHPDTHKPYKFNSPLPPSSDLTSLSFTQLDSMLDSIKDVAKKYGWSTESARGGIVERSEYAAPRWDDKNIDTYVLPNLLRIPCGLEEEDWWRVRASLHQGFHGDSDGEDLFVAWSSGLLQGVPPPDNFVSERDCRKKWKATKAVSIGTGTLAFIADKYDVPSKPEAKFVSDGAGLDLNDVAKIQVGAIPWVVSGLLSYGAHLLVGRPKGGKSWLTLDLLISVANGAAFLGSAVPTKAEVLWVAAEDTRDDVVRRVQRRGIDRRPTTKKVHLYPIESLESVRCDGSFIDWLDQWLIDHPQVRLVIVDTQSSADAIWSELKPKQRNSAIDEAYNASRPYNVVGQAREVAIVLVHHTRKRNGKDVTDYHELINMAQTVVAGASTSIVIADHPDKEPHLEDARRVIAVRGRHIDHEITLHATFNERSELISDGAYFDVVQSEKQAETLTAMEELLEGVEPDSKGVRWTTQAAIATHLGKHKNTIGLSFRTMKANPAKMQWKQWRVVTSAALGVGFALRNAPSK